MPENLQHDTIQVETGINNGHDLHNSVVYNDISRANSIKFSDRHETTDTENTGNHI